MDKALKTQVNKQAAIYGLIVGIIVVVLTTIVNMGVRNIVVLYAGSILSFILYMVALGIFAAQIRKSLGGYIDFRTVFGCIFIMVLISVLIWTVYSFIYPLYIDPQIYDKMKDTMLTWMASKNVPQASIDKAIQSFDEKAEAGKHFDVLRYFESVVFVSLVGLIIAAIVKKNKPVNMA